MPVKKNSLPLGTCTIKWKDEEQIMTRKKRHIWKQQRTSKQKLQQKDRLWTLGEKFLRVLKPVYPERMSP